MKTLSLLQPWATLVVMGHKKLETRSWTTRYRGPLLIHASKGRSGELIADEPPFQKYIKEFNSLPFGAIIGSVNLDHILKVEELFLSADEMNRMTLEERAFGDYTPGRYVWQFSNALPFRKPTPVRGSLNLWDFPLERLII
jgi:activating signal cointegrator 1